MERPPLVIVKWTDPHSVDEWAKLDDSKFSYEANILSVGFLIKEDKQRVVIALNFSADKSEGDEVSCSMVIPRRCIDSIEEFDL